MSTNNTWSFEGYWNAVLGAHSDARDVIRDFDLDPSDRVGLAEWLGNAEAEAARMGGVDVSVWEGFHGRALDLLAGATIRHIDNTYAVSNTTELANNGQAGDHKVTLCCGPSVNNEEWLFFLATNADDVLLTDDRREQIAFIESLGLPVAKVIEAIRVSSADDASKEWAIDELKRLPPAWEARDEQGCRETLDATDQESAEEAAIEWLRDGTWDTERKPVFADAKVYHYGEEMGSVEMQLDQDEPKCVKLYPGDDEPPVQEHSWADRGVFGGSAGGVNSQSVCEHCGCVRTRHSRYQRHDTGAVVEDVTTYQMPE